MPREIATAVRFFRTETTWTGRGDAVDGLLWSDGPAANGCSTRWLVVGDEYVLVRKLRKRERAQAWLAGFEWIHEIAWSTDTGSITQSANRRAAEIRKENAA